MPSRASSSASPDPLSAAVEIVRTFATRKSIPWIPGFIGEAEKHGPVVQFELTDTDGAVRSPTALAAEAQALVESLDLADIAMLVVSVDYLTTADWSDAVERYQAKLDELSRGASSSDDDDVDMSDEERQETLALLTDKLRETKAAKQHVGMVSRFDISAITRNPTIVVNWWDSSDWYDVVVEAERAIEQAEESTVQLSRRGDDDDEEDSPAEKLAQREFETLMEQRRLWNGPKRKEVIRQLAEHAEFPKCKTEADKVYVLDKLLETPSDVSETLKKELARAATALYKFEIAGKTT